MARARRVAGIVLGVTLAIVATTALLVGGVSVLLRTSWGGERVLRFALPRVNAVIAGRVEVAHLSFGGNHVALQGITLRDPEGQVVVRVESLKVAFSPLALLRSRLDLAGVTVDEPMFELRQDARGSNLARALAPRHPVPAVAAKQAASRPGTDGKGKLVVDLRQLSVRGGSVDLRDARDLGDVAGSAVPAIRHVLVQDLVVDGTGQYAAADGTFVATLAIQGKAEQPLQSPVALTWRAHGTAVAAATNIDTAVDASVGANRVRASVSLAMSAESPASGDARLVATVKVAEVHVTPGLVQVFAPAVPLRAALSLSGEGTLVAASGSQKVAGQVALHGGGASLTVRGSGDLVSLNTDGVVVQAQHIDLSRLVVDGPPSDFGFDLQAHGQGRSDADLPPLRGALASLRGALTLVVPPGQLGGRTLGPIRLRADADHGRYKVMDLLAVLPGARLTGAGQVTGQQVAFRGAIDLRDLGAAVRSATAGRSARPPLASGRGRIDVTISGTPAAPAVQLRGRLANVIWQDAQLRAVTVDARLPNARRIQTGTLSVSIPVAEIGGRTFRGFELSARGTAERLDARVSLKTPEPIKLDLGAAWKDIDRRELVVDRLALDSRTGVWKTARPVRIAIDERRMRVSGLDLRSGGQSIRLDALRTPRRLDADLVLTAIDLGRLPATLLPPSVKLAGKLDGKIAIQNTGTGAPAMHVDASVDGVALGPLAALAGYRPAVGGTASLRIALDGPLTAPLGELTVQVSGVTTGRFPPTDAGARLVLGAGDVRAHVQVTRGQSTLLVADGKLDVPATSLKNPAKLTDAPLALHVLFGPFAVQRLGLPPETERDPPRILKGRLRAEVQVEGTARNPRATMRLDAAEVRIDKALVGTAQADVSYLNGKADADVKLISANKGTLHLVASAAADLGYPQATRGLDPRRIPISARLDAQGFDVAGFSGATRRLRSVGGQIFSAMQISGTAGDPRLNGRLEWKDGLVALTGMGEYRHVHLLAHGDAENLTLDDLSAESGGGRARVTGTGEHRAGVSAGANGGPGYQVRVAAELRSFPIYVEGQALAKASLRATADAQVAVQKVTAKVAVGEAHIELSDAKRKQLQKLARPGDVVLVSNGSPLNDAQAHKLAGLVAARAAAARTHGDASDRNDRAGAAAKKAPPVIVVSVDAPRNLWVKGKDANIELGFQRGFRIEGADVPRVYGEVIVRRGRLDVVGRRFDLKSGSSIHFSGPTDTPELDVNATHENRKENITVLVAVKGTPGHLGIAISAPDRPDLSETQLYTLIVTGRTELGGGSAGSTTASDKAASLVGGLMAARLQKALSKKLPFDVLTIEAGDGLSQPRLEAGTYVTSNLYVGYKGNLGADPSLLQNRNAVHLEYELTSRWSFEGEYGDAKTGTADLIWTKRY